MEENILQQLNEMMERQGRLLEKLEALEAENKNLREELQGRSNPRKAKPTPRGQATRAITSAEFRDIINAMRTGSAFFRPNPRIAAALIVEANTGMRISDIVQSLKLSDIVRDGDRLRLNVVEQKTGKLRTFTVRQDVYDFLVRYCYENGIRQNEQMFDVTTRAVQQLLAKVVDYLGLEGRIGTHSFRKLFATTAYQESGHDIAVVKELLQHADLSSTQRYIGMSSQKVEDTLSKCGFIPE